MNNLLPPADVSTVSKLLRIIADPAKAQVVLDELAARSDQITKANDEARNLRRTLDADTKALALRTEALTLREEQVAKLNLDARETALKGGEAALAERGEAVAARETAANAHHADGARLKADYEARLAKLRNLAQ